MKTINDGMKLLEMCYVTECEGSVPGDYYKTVEEAEAAAAEFAVELFNVDNEDGRVALVGGRFFIEGQDYIKFTDLFDMPQKYIDAYHKWVEIRSNARGSFKPSPLLSGEYSDDAHDS